MLKDAYEVSMFRPAFYLIFLALSMNSLWAGDFDGGDFSKGKSGWIGDGKLVYLKSDGTISPDPLPNTTPVIQMSLNSAQFKEFSQRFTTPPAPSPQKALPLNGTLTFKASPDFKINAKSSSFSKEITWTAGSRWYWARLVHPQVDLCLRLETIGHFIYQLSNVIPGADWQTLAVHFDNVDSGKEANFSIVVPPGTGFLLIKDVTLGQ